MSPPESWSNSGGGGNSVPPPAGLPIDEPAGDHVDVEVDALLAVENAIEGPMGVSPASRHPSLWTRAEFTSDCTYGHVR